MLHSHVVAKRKRRHSQARDTPPGAKQKRRHLARFVIAREIVVLAQEEARILKHNCIGTERILLGLVPQTEGVAARILLDHSADAETVRDEVIGVLTGPGGRWRHRPADAGACSSCSPRPRGHRWACARSARSRRRGLARVVDEARRRTIIASSTRGAPVAGDVDGEGSDW